jgi:hypothetical protein
MQHFVIAFVFRSLMLCNMDSSRLSFFHTNLIAFKNSSATFFIS